MYRGSKSTKGFYQVYGQDYTVLEPGADIYVDQQAPIEVPTGKAFKLKKSLYSLKQAPLNWNLNINKYLNEIWLTRIT